MWKRGISEEGIERIAKTVQEDPVYLKAVYALDGETKYRVKPIWKDEALATLENEETGGSERIPIGDLLEFYTLLDMDENVISRPEEYAGEDDEDYKYEQSYYNEHPNQD